MTEKERKEIEDKLGPITEGDEEFFKNENVEGEIVEK
ncbi:hypothetical protein FUSO4_05135 [Fusobacterium necrophorum DJ-1]|uniref:Uncharacterized protein n=2 Tax=Fusobacterium necrophorum TaxID=859 RepID=A0AB73BTV3_9FUSO|nr:hypothetical protein FUSO3_11435 [Fusobacterium necrophorum BL]KDE64343.1 hypothetical protein FUSO5_06600 [Fusobacterium necrophorum BFTR-1]KDE66146.1 hypothetical protein FUSO4_05135 [Fusobacterium necrophorum DJ-1]KDE68667.1 hypothetical protein FUSO6_08130 [Fusobacterium necrophorum DAB]KDE69005.1 hypothetical protein FUSO7_12320 [Fusobacterium necrophorum BFTR-2]KDE72253.1 hypothetical protein FUSO8_05880 [Fusobacterium necrophorum DJ-2]SQC98578.1 Uncharacterised protein [Fusobacteriu